MNVNFDWHKIFLIIGSSILAGIYFALVFSADWTISFLFLLISLVFLFVGCKRERLANYFIFILIFTGLSAGVARVALMVDHSRELDQFLGQKVEIIGRVASQPDERETATRFIFKPDSVSAKLMITAGRFPEWQNGDHVLVSGKLQKPRNIVATSSQAFDYSAYLAKDGVHYEMYLPAIKLISRPSFGLAPLVNYLRSRLLDVIGKVLPEPESTLLAGIVLGARRGLDMQVADDFTKAGVSHILVLSGFNITVVASTLLIICSHFSRLVGGLFGILGIILFGLIAGGGAVVWRSVVMAVIAWYARLSGRLFDVSSALLATALAITLWNPVSLSTDLGFQLSLLAMLGIVYVSPMLEETILRRLSEKGNFRAVVATTFGAQLAVLPLIWQATGHLSLMGFVSNLVILPLVPTVMGLGGIILALGFILPILAWPLAPLCYVLLRALIILAHWFASLPLANLSLPASNFIVVFIYFLLTITTIKYWRTKSSLH